MVIDRLYARASNLEQEELEDFAAAERYIQQSYEGRSLFELIQNGRDAAQLVQQPGHIELEVVERTGRYWLLISNSGQPFTADGVKGITRIGQSTKADAKTIGFKGIGFKAVRQLTDAPRVVTQWGTLLFNAEQTRNRYLTERHQPAPPVIPLFRLPHYAPDRLTTDELARGIATRVELPLRDEEARALVETDLSNLTARQLVLLGMVRKLTIRTLAYTTVYGFEPQPANRLNVVRDGVVVEQYRLFEPTAPITFPAEMLTSIGPEEREIMQRMTQVDVRLLLPLDSRGRFVAHAAPLYLFYPLRLLSGFRFLIHSFFLVDPARTTLRRQCRPNEFLLQQIGQFIGGELVAKLVAGSYDTTEILCYQRLSPDDLTPLYDAAQRTLREVAFICLRRPDKKPRYLRPAEVICATPALASLLPSGRVAQRWVVPVADQIARRWLRTEFEVPELTAANLGQQLELECERQAGNVAFFQHLYQFLAAEKSLDLKGYRILLTQQGGVVAGGQHMVLYRTSTTAKVELTKSLQRQIHLLHADLQLSDVQLKGLEARTGLREMEPDSLATQLLRLMGDFQLIKLRPSILRALKDIANGSERARGWYSKVWLPVQGGRWVQPLRQPVYVERSELRQLYPKALFVSRTTWPQLEGDEAEWEAFLLQVGAWDKPGLYISPSPTTLTANDPRNESIRAWNPWRTTLSLRYDRLLDVPVEFTIWFTQQLLTRWPEYQAWLGKAHTEALQVSSQQSESWYNAPPDRILAWCGAMQWLRTASWVVLPGQPARPVTKMVGLASGTSSGPRTRLAEHFLPVWRLDPDQHHPFIKAVRLAHLNNRHLAGQAGMRMIRKVLQLTAQQHQLLTVVSPGEFEKFYNILLGRLQDYWEELPDASEQKASLVSFRNLPWLARHGDAGPLAWHPAHQLLYLDDKLAYEQLLGDLRTQPDLLAQLPPQFYYQFTKRDAQGFGRLAQHLGQSFTGLVRRTLRQVPEEVPVPLLNSQFVRPEIIIRLVALLEGHRRRQFVPADLTRLIATQVVTTHALVVAFRLAFARGARSLEFELEQPYFLAKATRANSSSMLYVQAATWPDGVRSARAQRDTAEALAVLLAHVLDASAQYLRQTLPNLLSASQLDDFDLRHELSADRLADLRLELYPPQETPEEEFWQAVRRALGLAAIPPHPLTGQSASVSALLADIPIATDSTLLNQFSQVFNEGALPQTAATRALLTQLLEALNLSVASLNAELALPLSFDALLQTEWELARQCYQATFAGRLHAGLTDRPAEQPRYLRYLAQYEQLPRPDLPGTWRPDYPTHLLASCDREFAGLLANTTRQPPQDATTQYEGTLNSLRAKVGRTTAEAEQFSGFILVATRRSLLFFGQQQKLIADYATWLRTRQAAEASNNPSAGATPPVNPANFDQGFSSLLAPPPPPPRSRTTGGGGGGGGSRETQQTRDRIGRLAEERAWVWLRAKGYRDVTWVSANAQKVAVNHPAHNLRGSDDHHYDLHYFTEDGEQVAIEVKGTSGQTLEFYLSREELAFAERQLPGRYRLLFVTQVDDDQACRLYSLENPFLYAGQEDRWHNTRFRAEADTVRVTFQREKQ
jgi:hypothetical protein